MMNTEEKLIQELIKLKLICEKLQYEEKCGSVFFNPASDEELDEWENENKIVLPNIYKELLKQTNGWSILGGLANFASLKHIVIDYEHLPKGYVLIGDMIGNGTLICFCKVSGDIKKFHEGEINNFSDLSMIIDYLLNQAEEIASENDCDISEYITKKNVKSEIDLAVKKKMIEFLEKKVKEGTATDKQKKLLAKMM